jgi:hypothetical protein
MIDMENYTENYTKVYLRRWFDERQTQIIAYT